MSIAPEGEDLRRAVKWISGEREFDPAKGIQKLIEAASIKYNLSPKDEAFLIRFFKKTRPGKTEN